MIQLSWKKKEKCKIAFVYSSMRLIGMGAAGIWFVDVFFLLQMQKENIEKPKNIFNNNNQKKKQQDIKKQT